MLVYRYLLVIVVSITTFLLSLTLDALLRPFSVLLQFFVQVPLLVLIVDEFRRWTLRHAPRFGLEERDVNGAFFFASPLAALGAGDLFRDIRALI